MLHIYRDDETAKEYARKAGLLDLFRRPPPGRNIVCSAMGMAGEERVLIIRWSGFRKSKDNGWGAVVGDRDGLLNYQAFVSGANRRKW